MENLVKKFTKSSLALPLIALALLLLFNALFVDNFFKIEIMQNGNLYGRPIDILYRASSLIILALGMTFVIATGGLGICRPVVCRQVLLAHFRQASGERGVQQVCTEHHHGNGIPEFQFGQLLCGLGASERC